MVSTCAFLQFDDLLVDVPEGQRLLASCRRIPIDHTSIDRASSSSIITYTSGWPPQEGVLFRKSGQWTTREPGGRVCARVVCHEPGGRVCARVSCQRESVGRHLPEVSRPRGHLWIGYIWTICPLTHTCTLFGITVVISDSSWYDYLLQHLYYCSYDIHAYLLFYVTVAVVYILYCSLIFRIVATVFELPALYLDYLFLYR